MTEPIPSARLVCPALLLGACLWLLASWLINAAIDSRTILVPSAIAFAPAARGTLVSMLLGGLIAWPAWRLSQPPSRFGGGQIVADLLALLLISQVVIWPLALGARWSFEQAKLINYAVVLWMMPAAMLVWAGWLTRTGMGRALAMAGCVAMVVGGYVVGLLTRLEEAAHLTPITMIWMLADPTPGRSLPDFTAERLALLIAIIVGFALLLQLRMRVGRARRDGIMTQD